MESIIKHLEKNYLCYDEKVNFIIDDIYFMTYEVLGIKPIFYCKDLPQILEDNRLYIFDYDTKTKHCIYHFNNGIIFNPSTTYYPIQRDDLFNICNSEFEPSDFDYQKFWDFIGMTRNTSGVMNFLTIEKNSEMWCLFIQFLHANNMKFVDFENYIKENGPYRNDSFNKLHYLSFFIRYFYLINKDINKSFIINI